jgi:hypothetical protein
VNIGKREDRGMLGRKNYTKEEIDTGRAMVEADLRAYRRLPDAAKTKEFEAVFFNRAIQLLDYMFVHRLRAIEGKDGNPLIEVRVLCNSILLNDGRLQVETPPEWPMSAGRALKLPPEKTVLKLKAGDVVKLSEADYVRLSKAFFAVLEEKYLKLQASDRPLRRRRPRFPIDRSLYG